MNQPAFGHTRRDMLRWGVATAAVAGLPATTGALAADADPVEIVMDGHVHVTNRIYWKASIPGRRPSRAGTLRGREARGSTASSTTSGPMGTGITTTPRSKCFA